MRYVILGQIHLCDSARLVSPGGPQQVRLLSFLLIHANRAVSADEQLDGLSGESRSERTRVRMAVALLRAMLADAGGRPDQALRTVAGGYLLSVRLGVDRGPAGSRRNPAARKHRAFDHDARRYPPGDDDRDRRPTPKRPRDLCATTARTAAQDDILTQATWRGVSAKILAREGRYGDGEALARPGVALLDRTDLLSHRGDAMAELADVLELCGTRRRVTRAREAAIALYEHKGNVAAARRAALLPEIS